MFEFVAPASVTPAATGVNLEITGMMNPQFSLSAVEASPSLVVGPLPLLEEVATLWADQDHLGSLHETVDTPVPTIKKDFCNVVKIVKNDQKSNNVKKVKCSKR